MRQVADRVQQFLRGRNILVTGVTGFLGKPLLEKLLRAVPELGRVYLLIRSQKGGTGRPVPAQERFEREVLAAGAFDRLREEWKGDFERRVREKVCVLNGDIGLPAFGLSPAEYRRLTETVSVVVNSAAVVVFDERLDYSLQLNAEAPRRLIQFARECREGYLLHVSTAYVNGPNPDPAPERLIPRRSERPEGWRGPLLPDDVEAEIQQLLERCRQIEAHAEEPAVRRQIHIQARRLRRMRPALSPSEAVVAARERWLREQLIQLGMAVAKSRGWNDTYTYTKALGEQVLAENRGAVPVAIVRPSIIESSFEEPDAGWIDGLRMADPIIIAYGKGRLPEFPAVPSIQLDLIPVDFVVNAMLVALAELGRTGGLQVYQVASGEENPVTFRELYDHTRAHFQRDPMLDRNGRPVPLPTWSFPPLEQFQRRFLWTRLRPLRAAQALVERLPGRRWRELRSRIASLASASERLYYYTVIYGPYITRSYHFESRRTRALFEKLTPEERARWNFDVRRIDWGRYIQEVHIPGLKRNVLKMDPRRVRPRIAEEELLAAEEDEEA
ncbi:MAG: hypothetical protein KatS3mg115_0825 [Candidatus Poribacteria bacterium]|nr:MAG: hypothetical protein KatS3mg115_0825 [Candidatus Poribacteria bacterium]